MRGLNPETCRYPVAAAAGLLLALAFPQPGWSGLAWVAPGMILLAAAGLPSAGRFRVGWVAGLAAYLGSLRWLLAIPFPSGAVAAWLALGAYCALYPAVWCWLVGWGPAVAGADDPDRRGPGDPGLIGPWRDALRFHALRPWGVRAGMALAAAVVWVGLEMVRGRFLSGFPWNFLGLTQWRQPALMQTAAFAGIHGVSFLVCWGSAALMGGFLVVGFRPRERWLWTGELRVPVLVILVAAGLGYRRILATRRAEAEAPPSTATVALIQPSIRQTLLWDPAADATSFGTARRLTGQALAMEPDLLVWPEGAFGLDADRFREVTGMLSGGRTWWVFGAEDLEERPDGGRTVFNAAFLAGPGPEDRAVYHKRRLVIFGEYVPLERWLPFLRWLTPIGGGFGRGTAPGRFQAGPGGPVASPVICFEDVFPHGTRDHVRPDTDFLLELTNDGWFGHGSAQWQHAAMAAFRAVENGVPVVRATNNGLTGWFDALGVERARLRDAAGGVYGEGWLLVTVPRAGGAARTWYHARGDVLGWLCVAALVPAVALRRARPRKAESKSTTPVGSS